MSRLPAAGVANSDDQGSERPRRYKESALSDEHQERFGFTDGLRALGILCLLCWAVARNSPMFFADQPQVRHALLEGVHGIDIFMVLSGFLLAYPVLAVRQMDGHASLDLGRYAVKRLLRILPLYALLIALLVGGSHFGTIPGSASSLGALQPSAPDDLLRQLLFVGSPEQIAADPLRTLALALRWYLVFPLFLVLWAASPRVFLGVLALISVEFLLSGSTNPDLGALPALMLGIAAADLHLRRHTSQRWAALLFVLFAGAAFFREIPLPPGAPTFDLLWEFAAASLVIGVGSVPLLSRLFSFGPLHFLGAASFSIYITYGIVMNAALSATAPAEYPSTAATEAGLSVLIGLFLWRIVDCWFAEGAFRDAVVNSAAPGMGSLLGALGIGPIVSLAGGSSEARVSSVAPDRSVGVTAPATGPLVAPNFAGIVPARPDVNSAEVADATRWTRRSTPSAPPRALRRGSTLDEDPDDYGPRDAFTKPILTPIVPTPPAFVHETPPAPPVFSNEADRDEEKRRAEAAAWEAELFSGTPAARYAPDIVDRDPEPEHRAPLAQPDPPAPAPVAAAPERFEAERAPERFIADLEPEADAHAPAAADESAPAEMPELGTPALAISPTSFFTRAPEPPPVADLETPQVTRRTGSAEELEAAIEAAKKRFQSEAPAEPAKVEPARAEAAETAPETLAGREEANLRARLEADRRTRENARREAEEVVRRAREEAQLRIREKAERREADLRARLELRAREEAEMHAEFEAQRAIREETAARERAAAEEAAARERAAAEEAAAQERAAAAAREREEMERRVREETARLEREAQEARERLEAERLQREEEERIRREEAARMLREAEERRAREEEERRQREEARRVAAERAAQHRAALEAAAREREEAERRMAELRANEEAALRELAEAEREAAAYADDESPAAGENLPPAPGRIAFSLGNGVPAAAEQPAEQPPERAPRSSDAGAEAFSEALAHYVEMNGAAAADERVPVAENGAAPRVALRLGAPLPKPADPSPTLSLRIAPSVPAQEVGGEPEHPHSPSDGLEARDDDSEAEHVAADGEGSHASQPIGLEQ